MISAILFDFDGVIIDSILNHIQHEYNLTIRKVYDSLLVLRPKLI